MKSRIAVVVLLSSLALFSRGAVPAADKLLPADTLFVLSIPDLSAARAIVNQSPPVQLWRDPEMKAFHDKFVEQLRADLVTPLEQALGVSLADFAPLAQGQLTLAVLQHGGPENRDGAAWLLLLDAKDKGDQLKTQLAGLQKKWVEAGQELKTERIRDVEFSTWIIRDADLANTLQKVLRFKSPGSQTSGQPKPKGAAADAKSELLVGQSESLLVIGNSAKAIEELLVRQTGGAVPSLSETAAYEASRDSVFRDAFAVGFVNFQLAGELMTRAAAKTAASAEQAGTSLPLRLDRVLEASGLLGVKGIALAAKQTPAGLLGEVLVNVPESDRRGLFKVLAIEPKASEPPPFVPANAVKFGRWRINGPKAWAALETLLNEISPQIGGFVQMALSAAGKDKDPNFDFRRSVIENLGDDLITYQKNPPTTSVADLASPPELTLVGSPNPEQLLAAVRVGAAFLPSGAAEGNEREFLGRKIFTLPLQPLPTPGGTAAGGSNLHFAASGGYLAASQDVTLLEDYLRSSEAPGKALRETDGLREAADRVGGMSTGVFGFANDHEAAKVLLEVLRQKPESLMALVTPEQFLMMKGSHVEGPMQFLLGVCDFSLLPPFEKISQYFHFSVSSLAVTPQGLSLKAFAPTPPPLKQ